MVRFLIGLPVAALATGVLFIVMYGFVKPGEIVVEDAVTPPTINIFAKIDETPDTPAEAPIDSIDKAPPPPQFVAPRPGVSDQPLIIAQRPTIPVPGPGTAGGTAVLLPVATLAPQFPGRCQASGTEGYAVVRYDVTTNGQVVNAEIVERSHRCFEEAALQAIRGWRYQPAIGQTGYIARGVTRRFSFELNEA